MKEKSSAIYSEYIIDGIRQELTPAQMLGVADDGNVHDVIVDETRELKMRSFAYDENLLGKYLQAVLKMGVQPFPMEYASSRTKNLIALSLIDSIWKEGSFKLQDLSVRSRWSWDCAPIGNMAAFYQSVKAVGEFVEELGIELSGFDFQPCPKPLLKKPESSLRFTVDVSEHPFSDEPDYSDASKVPSTIVNDPQSWIVYVPFDTCDYRLGGSLLCAATDSPGGPELAVGDADYFMDCFELVRELVEDGIILSGITVGDGGLLTAVRKLLGQNCGTSLNIGDIMKNFRERDPGRILFAEVPGVLFQIRDMDYDYLDAEMLLQDIAFFPLGHPVRDDSIITVSSDDKSGVEKILESIIRSQSSEGED